MPDIKWYRSYSLSEDIAAFNNDSSQFIRLSPPQLIVARFMQNNLEYFV